MKTADKEEQLSRMEMDQTACNKYAQIWAK